MSLRLLSLFGLVVLIACAWALSTRATASHGAQCSPGSGCSSSLLY
jgi:hypothetical protein